MVAAGGAAGLAGVLETTAFAPLLSGPGGRWADEDARPASPRRFSRSRIDKTSVEVDADELAAEELVELASVAGGEDADDLAEGELAELAEVELVELAVDSWARRAKSSSIDSIRSIAQRVGGGRRRSKRPENPSPRSECYLKAAVTASLRSKEGGAWPRSESASRAKEASRHSCSGDGPSQPGPPYRCQVHPQVYSCGSAQDCSGGLQWVRRGSWRVGEGEEVGVQRARAYRPEGGLRKSRRESRERARPLRASAASEKKL
jgi:hypothetical protein